MYQIENAGALLRGGARRLRSVRVSRTVLFLGLTSLFTDISAEMVATILPLYLFFTLGFTPLQFGILDGIYQGAAALVRVASGFAGDRWRRHKEIAALGYGISAFSKLGFLAVGGVWSALAGIVLVDRTGKGIRTAPRDALISLSSARADLATAFGVHRALDTAGAMLGPLVAFALLTLAPGAFDAIFVVSFCFAVVGLSILLLFVQPIRAIPDAVTHEPVSVRSAVALLGDARFRTLVLVGAALGLVTLSDGFLYLGLQRRLEFEPDLLPLLFVATALVYMVLAIPMGKLADRVGRARVFVGGYVLLLLIYASLLLPPLGTGELALYFVAFGAYYAATDGVLMAMASAVLPPELRGSGLAAVVTAITLARLLSSVLFGALWTAFGIDAAVLVFALGLALGLPLVALALARSREREVAHA